MNEERFEIINVGDVDCTVLACKKESLPKKLRSEPFSTTCTVFYHPRRDALVLNMNNPNYLKYKDLLVDYLNLNHPERKMMCDYANVKGISFFSFVNKVLRIQRKKTRK